MALNKVQVLALVTCTLLGCTTVDSIEMSADPATLKPFKTYRIHEEQYAFATAISEQERTQVATELRKAAVSAFNDRGYQESSTDADVLVSLGAMSRLTTDDEDERGEGHIRFVDPSVVEAGRPTSVPGSEPTPSGVGREGDLLLYLLDPKTKRVIWRASTSGSASTPSEAMRKARKTYAAMVDKLPAAGGGTHR
jgi:Domain of unknown function (DUF4136)